MALGVSAIGQVGNTYYQNAKTLPEYYESLEQGRLPVVRGYAMDQDDALRRDVIMAIMCQGRLDFDAVEDAHGIEVPEHFQQELRDLQPMAASGLVELHERSLQVTEAGWFLVRAVAMVFDRHLRAAQDRRRFSKVV